MHVSLVTLGFAALMLLSACTGGTPSEAYNGTNLRQAQDASNAGNGAACTVANNLRMEEYYRR